MKKFLVMLTLMLTMCVASFAQVQYYRSTAYAFAKVNSGIYSWGDWEDSNVRIAFNLNSDVITIYSPKTQIYKIIEISNGGNAYTDESGGNNVKFYVIDQDGDRGHIRLRIESNGNSQIYVDFKDCAWVYNVRRTS